jgi:hypothetical protein
LNGWAELGCPYSVVMGLRWVGFGKRWYLHMVLWFGFSGTGGRIVCLVDPTKPLRAKILEHRSGFSILNGVALLISQLIFV